MKRNAFFNNTGITDPKASSTFYKYSMSPLARRQSEQLKVDKTMHLDKLKLRLTQYLDQNSMNQLNFENKSQNIGETKIKKMQGTRYIKPQKYYKKESKLNRLIEERKKKKGSQEKSDEDIKKMYRKSFTIKEIHPQPKHKLVKESMISDPDYGKNFGSYYQIVALQKKFDRSQYYWNSSKVPHLLSQNQSLNLKNRYQSRMSPENRPNLNPDKIKELRWMKEFDGGIIEPWSNPEENLFDIQD